MDHLSRKTSLAILRHHRIAYRETKPARLTEAVHFLSIAVALKSDSSGVHFNLGIALHDQGRLDHAGYEYSAAIRINPNDAEAHNHLVPRPR
jgi:Flp pilus assembly protein TadD